MRLFKLLDRRSDNVNERAGIRPAASDPGPEAPTPEAVTEISSALDVDFPDRKEVRIRVARTLVKSEPEVEELVSTDSRLQAEGVRVSLVRKGFGTRVAIVAAPSSGLEHADLEQLLNELAEPHKRPFSNS